MLSTKFQVNWSFGSEEKAKKKKKKKKKFSRWPHGGHLGFLIETIFAIFDLHVTLMLPTSFKSIDLLVQEKERKIDFNMATTEC